MERLTQLYTVDQVLLVNPVVDPAKQLQQFLGEHYIEKRQMELVVTSEDVSRYHGREGPADPTLERLVILARDDEVLDFRLAADLYAGTKDTLAIFNTGGHTLDVSEPRFADLTLDFLNLND